MTTAPMTDIGGVLLGHQGFAKNQTAADGTYIAGAEIDRVTYPAQSALVLCHVAFTSASGASGAKNTLTLALFDDTVTGMASEAVHDSDTYVYTWAADGANYGIHCLPVDLQSANRYIRAKAKLTESGTITISSQTIALAVVLGGLQVAPGSGYVAAGYENTTEAS